MSMRRVAPYVVPLLLSAGLLSAPSALAGPLQVRQAGATTIGHLAYLTKQTVKIATVAANGTTSSIRTVGPVSKPASAKQQVRISDLVGSGDGHWIAWAEAVVKPLKKKHEFAEVRTVLVLRDMVSGDTIHLTTPQEPVGFSGDALVTTDSVKTKRLVTHPSAHFVAISDDEFALGTAPQGVVDNRMIQAPAGPKHTDQLRLTTFAGAHMILHSYVLGRTDYRDPDSSWMSGDGHHLVVERGNHQDFDGLGPSSLADEFSLSGSLVRRPLGHYGTADAKWRVASVGFSGGADQVWAVWSRATKTGATSVVASYTTGKWHDVVDHGIAVAGNQAGYTVVQPGKWVSVGTDFPVFDTVPTADAVLLHAGSDEVLDAQGTAFVWVS